MNSEDTIEEASAATAEFEQELETLVLAAFAKGAAIEGTWNLELSSATAPNWTVKIRKTYSEQEAAYVPDFIDD